MKKFIFERFEKAKEYFSSAENYDLEFIVKTQGLDKNSRKEGKTFYISCPLHSDNTPSCSVDYEGNRYKCFSCDSGGNGLNLFYELKNLDKRGRGSDEKLRYAVFINDLLREDREAQRVLGFNSLYKEVKDFSIVVKEKQTAKQDDINKSYRMGTFSNKERDMTFRDLSKNDAIKLEEDLVSSQSDLSANHNRDTGDDADSSTKFEVKLNVRKVKLSKNPIKNRRVTNYITLCGLKELKECNIDTKTFVAFSIQNGISPESIYEILESVAFNINNKKTTATESNQKVSIANLLADTDEED